MDLKFNLTFAILILCFFGVKAFFDKTLLLKDIGECKEKQSIGDKEFEAIKKQDFSGEKIKCFLTCLGEKIGYIQDHKFSERGGMNAIELLMSDSKDEDKEKAKGVVQECGKKIKDSSAGGCDIGVATAECLGKGAVDVGLISPEKMKQLQTHRQF